MGDFLNDAKKFADEHEQQVEQGVDRAGQEIDERTGNRYDKQVEQGEEFIKDQVGKDDKR